MQSLVDGEAVGELFRLTAPLSFWGGVDAHTGRIIDPHHPENGLSVTKRIVVMPSGRGSSSSSSVLAEMIRLGTGPAGLILEAPDGIIVTGATVANLLYEANFPVLAGILPAEAYGPHRIEGGSVRAI